MIKKISIIIIFLSILFNAVVAKEVLYKKALRLYNQNKLDETIITLVELLRIEPENKKAMELFIKACIKKKEEKPIPPKPVLPIKPVVKPPLKKEKEPPKLPKKEEMPELIDFKFILTLYNKKMNDKVIPEIENLIKAYPKSELNNKMLYILSESYYNIKNYAAAIENYKKLINPATEFAYDANFGLAKTYKEQGDVDSAIVEYLRLINNIKGGKYGRKEEKEEVVIEVEPFPTPKVKLLVNTHLELAKLYTNKKEFNYAIENFSILIEKFPQSKEAEEALFRLAQLYEGIEFKDYDKSYDFYNKLIKNYPDSEWVQKAKPRIEYIKKNFM